MKRHTLSVGNIVCFKNVYNINVLDLINRDKHYSKYMMVIAIIDSVKGKSACKVLCANGEINWVLADKLQKIE